MTLFPKPRHYVVKLVEISKIISYNRYVANNIYLRNLCNTQPYNTLPIILNQYIYEYEYAQKSTCTLVLCEPFTKATYHLMSDIDHW